MKPDDAIAKVQRQNLPALRSLYKQLHETDPAPEGAGLNALWDKILADPDYHILLLKKDGKIAAGATVVVVKNLTRNTRPYAIVKT
jgi:hypothetical protein